MTLLHECSQLPRSGDRVHGFAVGLYPTDHPTLPDTRGEPRPGSVTASAGQMYGRSGGGAKMAVVHVVIEGRDLPGRTFCASDGSPLNDVHVGIQVRSKPEGLVAGDAPSARWDVEVNVIVDDNGDLDFRGPAVHGRRGDRFLYLTWGNITDEGHFEMFRRAKLMLNRVDAELVRAAEDEQRLVGTIRLRDAYGAPRCARVDPPDLTWTLR